MIRWVQGLFEWSDPPEKPVKQAAPAVHGGMSEAALEVMARQWLCALGCNGLSERVCVRWNRRLKTTAGLASYSSWTVSLNPRLADFGVEEVDRTLRHEVAHLLARYRHVHRRLQPHGEEWKQACTDLGLPEEKRCHELPLPGRKMERHLLYRCKHCRDEFRRVRPFRRPVACLKCCRAFNHGKYDDRYRYELVKKG